MTPYSPETRIDLHPNPKCLALCFVALLLSLALVGCGQTEPEIKRVTFYPTYAYQDGDIWRVPLRVWVSEQPDALREATADFLKGKLLDRAGIGELDSAQEQRFDTLAYGFIADSESNEVITIKFDNDPEDKSYTLRSDNGRTTTDRNGLLEGVLSLSAERAVMLAVRQEANSDWLRFRAVSEQHIGQGVVRLIARQGTSIISDIDDTIKVTDILAGEETVIRNTFFRPFEEAPCMQAIYATFSDDIPFHYVSGGPWQLYEPLQAFISETPFPVGTFHMKNVRTNLSESESYEDLWKLLVGGSKQLTFEQKVAQIGTLFERFPERGFVLIGDSGERDPEIFSEIRTRFPDQVREIHIRDVADSLRNEPERLRGMQVIDPERCPASSPPAA